MLDIDDTSELMAVAGQFSAAMDAAARRALKTAEELELPERPASTLDRTLVDRIAEAKAQLMQALIASDSQISAVYQHTLTATRELDAADQAAAARFTGSESPTADGA